MENEIKKFARVPLIPGEVKEVYIGEKLFPMYPDLAKDWYEAPHDVIEGDIYNGFGFEKTIPIEQNNPTLEYYTPSVIDKKINLVEDKVKDAQNESKEFMECTTKKVIELQQKITQTQDSIGDTNDVLSAIKGFLMILPEVQKSLREIRDMIESK